MTDRPFGMTRGAALDAEDMRIPPAVIRRTLTHPERTWVTDWTMSRRTPNGPRKIYCQGKLSILVAVNTNEVLRFFWSGDEKPTEATWKEGGWTDY